jgi:hypothetical protein
MFLAMLNLYCFLFSSFTIREQSLIVNIQRKVNEFCYMNKTYVKITVMKKNKKQE